MGVGKTTSLSRPFQEYIMPGYMKGKAKAASYDSFAKSMSKPKKNKSRKMKPTKMKSYKSSHGY